jgi:hypothetical protein
MGSTTVKGLKIFDGTPSGAAGVALNDNFTALANRSGPAHSHAVDPGVNDDAANTGGRGVCYNNSIWRNTATGKFWICTSDSTGAATWLPLSSRRDITFGILGNFAIGTELTNRVPLMYAGLSVACRAVAKTSPTGASAIFVIKKNGSTTIATITILAGQTTATAPPSGTFVAGDYLTIDCTQVGSSVPGADVNITLTIHYQA